MTPAAPHTAEHPHPAPAVVVSKVVGRKAVLICLSALTCWETL